MVFIPDVPASLGTNNVPDVRHFVLLRSSRSAVSSVGRSSWMILQTVCPTGLDTDCLAFNVGAQLRTKSLVGDQVDGTAKQVFQVELHAKVAF